MPVLPRKQSQFNRSSASEPSPEAEILKFSGHKFSFAFHLLPSDIPLMHKTTEHIKHRKIYQLNLQFKTPLQQPQIRGNLLQKILTNRYQRISRCSVAQLESMLNMERRYLLSVILFLRTQRLFIQKEFQFRLFFSFG